jgi:hypothetical protein
MHARRIEISAIIATVESVAERIGDRFAGRGITDLARELVEVARETEQRLERARQPRWALRALVFGLIVLGIAVVAVSASVVSQGTDIDGIEEWLAVTQNAIQDVVFIGFGVVFLLTAERRLERRDALAGLQELRSIAHVIDMHQLTKDPDSTFHPEGATAHSPSRSFSRFELSRYLDYCSELLSVTSKLAALYAQDSSDAVVLSTVREIQELTGALSSKIWQKIMILDAFEASHPD